MDKRLEKFLQQLIQQVHGAALPAALVEKMLIDLNLQLQQQLHQVTLAALTDESDRVAYQNKILGQVSADELGQFLYNRVPDLQTRLADCLVNFQQEYINVCQNQA